MGIWINFSFKSLLGFFLIWIPSAFSCHELRFHAVLKLARVNKQNTCCISKDMRSLQTGHKIYQCLRNSRNKLKYPSNVAAAELRTQCCSLSYFCTLPVFLHDKTRKFFSLFSPLVEMICYHRNSICYLPNSFNRVNVCVYFFLFFSPPPPTPYQALGSICDS